MPTTAIPVNMDIIPSYHQIFALDKIHENRAKTCTSLRIFKCLWDISPPSTPQMKRSSTSSVISSYWELQKAMANLSGMVAYCALEHACVRELIPVMQDPAYDQQAYYSEQWMHRTPPKATEDDLYDQGTGHL
ncbi:hypothetical protein CAN33_0052965 [Aspergillus niger]|uniref:Uncharacterized protein n=1 Tax=Aspergillus niger TaxID=5061 RepID=A0A505I9P9_ASPNG|nr:hypothetical protein CAN33_0052965 [Aspergillus niger]